MFNFISFLEGAADISPDIQSQQGKHDHLISRGYIEQEMIYCLLLGQIFEKPVSLLRFFVYEY